MTLLISALAFFLLITGLILVHEAGHFFAARRAKVEVEEFGFGLPPRALTLFTWQKTKFTLNWIPFGGFVRLKGEGAIDMKERTARGSFSAASIPARCIILVAGVAMNFLLALLIFLYGFSAGRWIPTYLKLDDMKAAADRGEISLRLGVIIDDVLTGGGAQEAGIPKGSILISVNETPIDKPQDVMDAQKTARAVAYTYFPTPDSTEQVTTRVQVEEGKTGVFLRSVPLELSAPVRGPMEAAKLALRETSLVTTQTVIGIAKLFTSLAQHGTVPEGVTGIVGIAQLTYTSVQEGFVVYLRLVALLSLSLAVLNILPFPALDGGRLIFVLSELFIRPGNRRVEIITNTVGFGVLIFVIVLVTLYDVFRLFH
jgi:regulator of sigma E protease